MRKFLLSVLIVLLLCQPVFATGETLDPSALQEGLEEDVQEIIPEIEAGETPDFWEKLILLGKNALTKASGSLHEGLRLCAFLLCIVTLCAVVDMSALKNGAMAVRVAGALGICAAVIGTFQAMIHMASETIEQISTYSSLLLPVLASASAMSGGVSSASALYVGTIFFSQLLLRLISKLLIPAVYFFLAIATAEAALGNDMLSSLREFVGWIISKSLRVMLFVFVAYMSITGVIGGSADAAAVKATKAAVSGMIPVVGSILSDASESLLAGASLMKNAAGVIGMLAVIGICILPLMRTGIHYLLIKTTAAVSGTVGVKEHKKLLEHITTAMGYLLAMNGAGGLLMLVSTVCFMRVMT